MGLLIPAAGASDIGMIVMKFLKELCNVLVRFLSLSFIILVFINGNFVES